MIDNIAFWFLRACNKGIYSVESNDFFPKMRGSVALAPIAPPPRAGAAGGAEMREKHALDAWCGVLGDDAA